MAVIEVGLQFEMSFQGDPNFASRSPPHAFSWIRYCASSTSGSMLDGMQNRIAIVERTLQRYLGYYSL